MQRQGLCSLCPFHDHTRSPLPASILGSQHRQRPLRATSFPSPGKLQGRFPVPLPRLAQWLVSEPLTRLSRGRCWCRGRGREGKLEDLLEEEVQWRPRQGTPPLSPSPLESGEQGKHLSAAGSPPPTIFRVKYNFTPLHNQTTKPDYRSTRFGNFKTLYPGWEGYQLQVSLAVGRKCVLLFKRRQKVAERHCRSRACLSLFWAGPGLADT